MSPLFRRAPHTLPLALCAALLLPATAHSAPTWETFLASDADVVPRVDGVLVPLPDGTTLLIGGRTLPGKSGGATPSVVRIHPGAVSPQPSLAAVMKPLLQARYGHTATLLPDGRILVVGGIDAGGNALKSAEIGTVDGDGNVTWEPTAPLGDSRSFHTATVLANGRVLVVGGRDAQGKDLGTAESFDPFAKNSEGKWNGVAPLPEGQGRSYHTATLLPDGRVLVAGGARDTGPLNVTWVLDPKAPTGSPWKAEPPLGKPRAGHQAVLMPSGQVLLVGGCEQAPTDPAVCTRPSRDEFFTSGTDAWALLPSTPPTYTDKDTNKTALYFGQSVVGLRNGWVLAAFGRVQLDGAVFDDKAVFTLRPASSDPPHDPIGPIAEPLPGTWHWAPSTEAPQLPTPGNASPFHSHAAAAVDAAGNVVVAGGRRGETSLVDSVDYLAFLPDGESCTHDDGGLECAGGVCLCATADCTTTACATPLPNGSLCTRGDDCTSRSCEPTTDQKAQVCCAVACKDTCTSDATGVTVGTCGATGCSPQFKSCEGYRCQGDACLDSCTTNDQCAINFYCTKMGKCEHVLDKGDPCTSGSECDSGFCVDKVCCDTSCTGFCDSCNSEDTGKADGTCTGRSPTRGPRAGNTTCDPSDDEPCGNTGLCDGKGNCAKASPGTPCDQDATRDGYACDDQGRQSIQMLCDGQGVCTNTNTDCKGYVCDPQTSLCAIRCNAGVDNPLDSKQTLCASGLVCGLTTGQCGEGSVCLPPAQYIESSGGSLVTKSCQHNRPCLPENPADCARECSSSLDCAPGSVCRLNGDCSPPAQPSDDDPDCFCAQPGPARPSTTGLLATLLAVGTLGARRRLSRRAARASR